MDYTQFKNKYQYAPFILSRDEVRLEKNAQIIRNQFSRWQDKGLIIKLKRGTYLLNKNDRKINPSRLFISNQLYGPSYVSLEYALNFYGLIPERVSDVTSVATRKTIRFQNELGVFTYQRIKPQAFRGFRKNVDEAGLPYFIAEPEKALLDFLYLNLNKFPRDLKDLFEISYRFQNLDILRKRKIVELAEMFNNHKLMKIVGGFCD